MKKELPRWLWIVLAAGLTLVIGCIDVVIGLDLNFFVFYFIPVSLAAWFVGRGASVSLAVLAALVWFAADHLVGHIQPSAFHAVWNTMIRLSGFLVIGWYMAEIRRLLDQERQLKTELQRALSEVKVLEAFLPICSYCKKIKNEQGQWQQMEAYIGQHTGTRFSHSYYPECAKKALEAAGLAND